MKKTNRIFVLSFVFAVGLALTVSATASADTIALWNYNNQAADNGTIANRTGTQNPAPNSGAGTQSQINLGTNDWGYNAGNFPDNTAPYDGDYSGDSATGSADIRYRAVMTTAGDGLQWNVSTAGMQNIQVQLGVFSQTNFGTSRMFSFEYSTDGGSTWSNNSLNYAGNNSWATLTLDLTNVSAVNNNPLFAFRFLSDANNTSQTLTFDYVNVTSVPIPAAAWLLGSGLLGLVVIKRKKQK
jgi:hypothetical protein